MIVCSSCGLENPAGAVFCARCDHFLEWDEDGRPASPAAGEAEDVDAVGAAPARDAVPEPGGERVAEALGAAGDDPARGTANHPAAQAAPMLPVEPVDETPEGSPEPVRVPLRDPDAGSMTPLPTRQRRSAPASSVVDIIQAIDEGRDLAMDQERPDLADHLTAARKRLESRSASLVVVGEFKRGKSTLVNALLQTAVCPVDADIVTSVPTIVTYAPTAGATLLTEGATDRELVERDISIDEVRAMVSEPVVGGDGPRHRSVEVRIPHRMLKAGLRLVDTPGVGGLDSAHGFLTLGTLSTADGVLFVTDASQELTGPELDFVRSVVERCPRTAVVVTKIDLHAEWRRITELDRGHLADAGLQLPVFPVSSFLRLRASMESALNAESGFEALVRYLATGMVAAEADRAAEAAAQEVRFVATQLSHQPRAVQSVLQRPEEAPQVIERLQQTSKRAASLAASSASWQQTLADGVQDLVADVDHDLQRRLRTVIQEVEQVIDQGDPKDTWEDTEVWLRRQIAVAAVENRSMLLERAKALTQDVAGRFDLEGADVVPLNIPEAGDSVALSTPMQPLGAQTGRVAAYMMAGRSAVYAPMALFGLVSAVAGASLLLPIAGVAAAALGAGIGQKMFRDEAKRQRTYRQQQAKIVARKFVDDVAFVMNKDTRDALRTTQRQLREDFQARAVSMQLSTQAALRSAESAAALDGAERAARAQEAADHEARLNSLRTGLRIAAGGVAAAGAAVATRAVLSELSDDDD